MNQQCYEKMAMLQKEIPLHVCPVCGGKIEHTGELIQTCGGVSLPWKCQECGATGDEGHNLVFDGHHYNVQDKDGKAFPA